MNMNFIVGLVEFVLALVALIVIHEFGHFVVARLLKVEVEEFGLGFPPRVATLFTAWGTKFTLNAIPLGGFVRPKGENDPDVPGGLAAANPWVRLAVFFAGPVMNLLLGMLLFAVLFTRIGVYDTSRVQVESVVANTPASAAGLQPGDILLKVNDQPVSDTQTLQNIISANLGKPVTIEYERGKQISTLTVTPRTNPPEGQGPIGIVMGYPTKPVSLIQAIPAGGEAVYSYSRALLALPGQMIRGTASPQDQRPVGLIGMFDFYQGIRQDQISTGLPVYLNILSFFATISTSLGLLNLVPFPALDGGRILFVLPEIVIRRRIPQQYENLINLVGFSLLILLMIYINLQDIIAPIQFVR